MGSLAGTAEIIPGRQTKRLLGQVLLDGRFVPPRALEQALFEQNRTNERLGEILVRMGILDQGELRAVLSVQDRLASLDDAVRAAAGMRELLGELLLRARRITSRQLDQALEEQRNTGEKLGEVLVRLGFLTARELDAALAFQAHQDGTAPEAFRLGEILVSLGHLTGEQLREALERQRRGGKRLGEILVEGGFVDPRQLSHGLSVQKKLVTAALVAVLGLAATNASAQDSPPRAEAGRAPGRVVVTATVAARARVNLLSQKRELIVTYADVARGYVDVPAASRIEVTTNSPRGYLLVFEVADGLFREVAVNGLGREVRIAGSGGFVPQPPARGASIELSYRFLLSDSARPGTYAWPVSISARPQ